MCFTSHIGLQAAFDADWQAGRITADSYRNGTEDGALAYKLLIQTGSKKDPFNYSQVCSRPVLKRERERKAFETDKQMSMLSDSLRLCKT